MWRCRKDWLRLVHAFFKWDSSKLCTIYAAQYELYTQLLLLTQCKTTFHKHTHTPTQVYSVTAAAGQVSFSLSISHILWRSTYHSVTSLRKVLSAGRSKKHTHICRQCAVIFNPGVWKGITGWGIDLSVNYIDRSGGSYLLRRGGPCGWKWTRGFRWWRRTGRCLRQACCAWSGPRGWRTASHREVCFVSRLKPDSWRCRLSSTLCAPSWMRRCGRSSWAVPSYPEWPECPGAPLWTRRGWRAELLNLEGNRRERRS